MNTVSLPKNKPDSVESAINCYQLLQLVSDIGNAQVICNGAQQSTFDTLYANFRSYGATPLGYFSTSGGSYSGHNVLLTDLKKNSATNYTLYIVDPNNLNSYTPEERTLKIDSGKLYLDDSKIDGLKVFPASMFHLFDDFDLDGAYNNENHTGSGTSQSSALPSDEHLSAESEQLFDTSDTATLFLMGTPFELVNASGETLCFNGEELSGTMEILEWDIICNGPDVPAVFKLGVKRSDSYHYSNSAETGADFCVISGEAFGSITGDGIREAVINIKDNVLSVDGTNMSYRAWLSIGVANYEHFYVKGTQQDAFQLYMTGHGVAAEGIIGNVECGFSSKDSIHVETAQVSFAETSQFDLSDVADGYIQFHTQNGDLAENEQIPINSFVRSGEYE